MNRNERVCRRSAHRAISARHIHAGENHCAGIVVKNLGPNHGRLAPAKHEADRGLVKAAARRVLFGADRDAESGHREVDDARERHLRKDALLERLDGALRALGEVAEIRTK